MTVITGQAIELAKNFTYTYLVKRDFDKVLQMMDSHITWIGTGIKEICRNYSDAIRLLEAEKSGFYGHFVILEEWYDVIPITDESCIVFGILHVKEDSENVIVMDMHIRFSLVCTLRKGIMKIRHLHFSIPNVAQGEDEFFPRNVSNQGNEIFKKVIREKTEELERLNEKFLESEKRYKFALEATNDVVFEIDLTSEKVIVDEQKFTNLYQVPFNSRYWKAVFTLGMTIVHPEDRENFMQLLNLEHMKQSIQEGNEVLTLDYRIKNIEHGYIWVRATMVPIKDSTGMCTKLIGSIKNINEKKKKDLEMQKLSQKDGLTGLTNKMHTEMAINEYINRSDTDKKGALMIIDLDNFKAVNDNLGHLFGDAVLTDIAEKIQKLFRSTDIIGRIGGDEFVVFLKGNNSPEVITKSADKLMDEFRRTYAGEKRNYKISGSVGIALYPEHGESYTELFRNADSALYFAKKQGKDSYCMFHAGLKDAHYIEEVKNLSIQQDGHQKSFKENIIEYIFKILNETKDIYKAIHLILEITGRHYNVSRVYVFENTENNLDCNNTFEWCKEGISSVKESMQNICNSQLRDYSANFNESGIFYCSDITSLPKHLHEIAEPQGVQSLLQCEVIHDGMFKGFVGFDDCTGARMWTKEEINSLTCIAEILDTFLLKKRAQDRAIQSFQISQSILDNLNSWAYVINKNTYELLFINKKTPDLVSGSMVGKLCYEVFFDGREAPCEQCPMQELEKSNKNNYTVELYNHVYNMWTSTTASWIKWNDNSEVCLLCSNDITKYKEIEKKLIE
ncbi:diguanylate cyclase domain-containing protein [Brevibacillus daliensis]|uniref:diguanylate cyclase domain-containing protein n=1 Tax=Brevibacillus daliensis TaxID=2892995 RepID=UPI001E49518F|nr:diguanylate cyclase [Brevibacillus daliensis]